MRVETSRVRSVTAVFAGAVAVAALVIGPSVVSGRPDEPPAARDSEAPAGSHRQPADSSTSPSAGGSRQRPKRSKAEAPREYGGCEALVARLEDGAWFDDVFYDNEGQVLILYGTGEAYRLTASDAECIGDSDALRREVEGAVAAFRESRASECESARLGQAANAVKDPRVAEVDREAWEAYREEVCAGPGPSLLLGEAE